MNIFPTLLIFLLVFCAAPSALARDTLLRFPITDPMQTTTAAAFTHAKFYFGKQPYPRGAKVIGTYTSRRITNAVGKGDKEACDWAFLSALKSLYVRTGEVGGNAVVNIRSITDNWPEESEAEYVCRAGNVVAKVYLEGTIVRLPD